MCSFTNCMEWINIFIRHAFKIKNLKLCNPISRTFKSKLLFILSICIKNVKIKLSCIQLPTTWKESIFVSIHHKGFLYVYLITYCKVVSSTRCGSHFENPTNFKILKEPLLVQKQTLHQQKALDLSFNLKPWKWVWRYHEGVTMS